MAAYEQAAHRNPQSITDLLLQIRDGSPEALDRLFPLVYEALRRIARRQVYSHPNDLRSATRSRTNSTGNFSLSSYLRKSPAVTDLPERIRSS